MKPSQPTNIMLLRALTVFSTLIFGAGECPAVEVVPNPSPSEDSYLRFGSDHWVSVPRRLWVTIDLIQEDRDSARSELQIRSLDTMRVLHTVKVPGVIQVICEARDSKALMIAGSPVNKTFFDPFVWFVDPESGVVVSRHAGGERVNFGTLVDHRYWVWTVDEEEMVVDIATPSLPPLRRKPGRKELTPESALKITLPNWLDYPGFTSGNLTAGSKGKIPGLWRNDTWERIDDFQPHQFRTFHDVVSMPGALFDPVGEHGLDVKNLLPREDPASAAHFQVKILEVAGTPQSLSTTKYGVLKLPPGWDYLVGCSNDQERVLYKVSQGEDQSTNFVIKEWNLASGRTSLVMEFSTMGHAPQFQYLDSGFGETLCARVYGPSAGAYGFGLATRQAEANGWKIDPPGTDDPNSSLHNLCGASFVKTSSGEVVLVKCFTSKIRTQDPTTGEQLDEVTASQQWWIHFGLQQRYALPGKGRVAVHFRNGGSQIFDIVGKGMIKPTAQMWVGPGDTWLVLLPDGRYVASSHGKPPVYFRQDARIFPVEDYDLAMNQPDAVAQALGFPQEVVSELGGLRSKRLQRAGEAATPADEGVAGSALTLSPPPPLTHDEDYLTLHASIVAGKQGVMSLELHVNDVPLPAQKDWDGSLAQGTHRELSIRVPLSTGSNKVQLSLKDEAGRHSGRRTFLVHRSNVNVEVARYVLAIGVSDYRDAEVQDLVYAAKDAHDIAAALTQVHGRFHKSEVLVLKDSQADHDSILAAKTFLQKSRPCDEVIIFVAGHGIITPEGDYAFCPADYRASDCGKVLRFPELEGLFLQAGSLNRLLLIDTCHAGGVDDDYLQSTKASLAKGGARSVVMRGAGSRGAGTTQDHQKLDHRAGDLFVDLRRTVGATVLSGASCFEFALEDDDHQNGIFTFALKEVLANAGKNEGSIVTAPDMVQTAAGRVAELTGGIQHPEARFTNMATDFHVVNANDGAVLEEPEKVFSRLAEWTSGWQGESNEDLNRLPSLFCEEVDYFGKKFTPIDVMNEEKKSAQQFSMTRYTPSGFKTMALEKGVVSLTYDLNFLVQKQLTPREAVELARKKNSRWKLGTEVFRQVGPKMVVESISVSREAQHQVAALVQQVGSEWKIRSLKVISP